MRLLRVGHPGGERPAVVDPEDETIRDLTPLGLDGSSLPDAVTRTEIRLALASGSLPLAPDGIRIGPPIRRPGKIIGIGLNYTDHAAEAGSTIPEQPAVFLKAPGTLSGPYDAIALPPGSMATDHEVELGVVVGRTLRHCPDPSTALLAVAGYVAVNDVTERDLAAQGPGWTKGKCCDTFTPVGPWLVTPDEVGDPQDLSMSLWVNGARRQSSSTALMAFGVAELLAYLSTLTTLEPGDLVLTGTPGGVAAGRPDPKPYLRAGDVVELAVGALGRQRTPVVASLPGSGTPEGPRTCEAS